MGQDRRSIRQVSSGEAPRAEVPGSDTASELRDAARTFVGTDEWKGSKIGYLSGLGTIRRGFSFIGGSIGSGLTQLRTFYNAMLGRGGADDEVEGVAVDEAGERFLESMRIHGRSVQDLDVIQNNTHRGCLFFSGMTVLALAYGLGSYFWSPNDGSLWFPFDFAYRFVPVAPLAAFALKWGYVNWMVRRRRYDGLTDYLKSGELMPQRARPVRKETSKRSGSLVKKAAIVLLMAGALTLSAAPQSHAQTTPPPSNSSSLTPPQDIFVTPGSKDLFMNMLSMIAPNVGPVPGFQGQTGSATPAHTAMAAGFMAFISALFFLAGMQVAWHTISGIVATAQEGKVLGQKWHQVWAPVRVVSGVGFLAPALGGFCVAQVVVLYLIAFGGQLANLIWTPYVEVMTSGMATPSAVNREGVATTIGQLTSSNEVLRSVFEKELCYATAKQNYVRNGYTGGAVPASVNWMQDYSFTMPVDNQQSMWSRLTTTLVNSVNATINPNTTTTVSGQTLDYGAVCGKITVPVTTATGSNPPPDVAAAVEFSKARKEAVDAVRAILQPIAVKAGQSYQNYQSASAGGSSTNGLYFSPESSGPQSGGNGSVQELRNAFQQARASYENIMTSAARNLMEGIGNVTGGTLTRFAQDAKDGGWATSGVYYLTISRIQSSIFAKASEQPIVTQMDINQANPSLTFALMGEPPAKPGPMPAYASWATQNIAQIATDATNNPINPYGAKAGSTDIQNTNFITTLFNKLEFPSVADLLSKVQPSPLNPLGDIINLGHTIIDSAWAALIAVAALSAATGAGTSNIVGTILGGSGAFSAAMGIISPLIVVLLMIVFAMGITMAFIIPMIPYIMVLFFIIGMLVLTLEALIAAPLWAFFHVRMDGQDLIDQVQRPGYMIAFNLLLRPALMMLGYILSFFAFGAVAWFISVTFGSAVTSATSGYFGGPITFVVMGGMMAYLYYQAAVRCFMMIVQVPDRVTRWFGVGGENLGEEHQSSHATGLVVGQIGSRVEGSLAPTVGNALARRARGGGLPVADKGGAPSGGAPGGAPGGSPGGGGPSAGGGGGSPSVASNVRGAVDAGVQANAGAHDSPPSARSTPSSGRNASPIAEKGTANQSAGGSRGGGGGGSSGGAAGSEGGGGAPAGDGYSTSTSQTSVNAPDKGAPNAPAPRSHTAAPASSSPSSSTQNAMNPGSASRIRPRTPPQKK